MVQEEQQKRVVLEGKISPWSEKRARTPARSGEGLSPCLPQQGLTLLVSSATTPLTALKPQSWI